jgi:MHS family proline/betaine transporter-like MFS transporter
VRRHPRELLATLGIIAVCSMSPYVILIYVPLFMSGQFGIDATIGQLWMSAGALLMLFMSPIAGYLSDQFGRRRLMSLAILLYGVMPYPLLASLVNEPTPEILFASNSLRPFS